MALKPLQLLRQMQAQPQHFMWVVLQQGAVRGILALKFLLVARLLGPEQIGLVGIALLALAIVESLSDTGLAQAIVQRPEAINAQQAGAVWTLQLSRGIILALLLLAVAVPVSLAFKVPASAALVALAAAIPLLRNSFNPGLFLVQRSRNFRRLSIYEATAAVLDLSVSLLLARNGFGAASLLIGTMVGDATKLVFTWTWFRFAIKASFQWRLIQEFTAFGKWIWGSSVVTLVLNQLDKILVARFLGTTEFGLYQVASRVAQLVIADGAVALGQYLYPTFSHRFRVSPADAREFFRKTLKYVLPVAIVIALCLAIFAQPIVRLVLGAEWLAAVPVLQVLTMAMFFGAVIAILVAYTRAIGRPKYVVHATLLQLLVLATAAPLLLYYYGAMGMACSTAIGGFATASFLILKIKKISYA